MELEPAVEPDFIRTEEYETPNGYSFSIVNIGPQLDPQLDIEALDQYLAAEKISQEPFTIYFDNRSFGNVVIDTIRGKRINDTQSSLSTLVHSMIYIGASTSHSLREVYFNTQDMLFAQIIRLKNLEEAIRHELKHLDHNYEWIIQKGGRGWKPVITRLAPFPMLYLGSVLIGPNARKIATSLVDGIPDLEQIAYNAGLLVIGLGLFEGSRQIFKHLPSEVEAARAENTERELKIFKTTPEYFLTRFYKKMFARKKI